MDLQSYIQLKEAYATVHSPKVEVTQELVEAFAHYLVEEEGLDLSDMTWDELTEAYIQENIITDTFGRGAGQIGRAAKKVFGNQSQKNDAVSYEKSVNDINKRKREAGDKSKTTQNDISAETKGRRTADPKYKPGQGVGSGNEPASPARTGRSRAQNRRSSSAAAIANTNRSNQVIKTTPTKTNSGGNGGGGGGGNGGGGGSAPAPKPTPKPAAQTGNKAADMKSWATANPKLAAAKAKRDASRGTSATSNPLMKDLAKRMPKPAIKPMAKPTVKPTASAAPAKPMSRIDKATSNIKPMKEDFDIVLDHLIENGFAAEDALKIMVTMSPEKLEAIIQEETGKEYHERMKNKTMPWKEPNATKATVTDEVKEKMAKDREAAEKAKADAKPAKKKSPAEQMADATGPRKGSNYRGD